MRGVLFFGKNRRKKQHQMGDAIELENRARKQISRTGRKLELNDDGSTAHPTITTRR
jgi:hypothetical protein